MILLLAGTYEGRQMFALLQEEGWPVIASTVSSYGAETLTAGTDGEIVRGELDKAGLIALIKAKDVSVLIDATHPFAFRISTLAMQAAEELKIDYLRLERKAMVIPEHPLVSRIKQLEEIEDYLKPEQVVFSTLGSKALPTLIPIVKRKKARLVVRVLPTAEVLRECEQLGLNAEQIIAVKGPFSKDLNQQLFMHYQAGLILSKESGIVGGLDTKMEAALDLDLPILVLSVPELDYATVMHSPQEILEYLRISKFNCLKI
ncbi:cobalt-precorrin-6x reductase [hydrocarbon metagenome]|uniref:Cobalt-precorrin-6x reductase n=1 Tax=hydrocarbon metagenome TaxID=938273 RepID=A0A0W8EA07_9ZZZZ